MNSSEVVMKLWQEIFPQGKPVIGMIHVQALPGAPLNRLSVKEIITRAVNEALLYKACGLDAVMLENMHDLPYLNRHVGPEVVAVMTLAASEVKQAVGMPTGIQVLAGANKEALAAALAAGLQFIRAEGFVFGHVADEGYMDSCAGELLRYRKQIGAEQIAILTDIKKKHSAHSITADVSLAETASAAEFFLADGLIVTGSATGKEVAAGDLKDAKSATALPVLIGSGLTTDNINDYWNLADGFIIGSWFKEHGIWSNPISEKRCRDLMEKVRNFAE